MVAQLNSSAGSHKGVLIGRYTPYIFEIIDSNIILRCLRRSRQHQSFELRCHLFLMSSPPLSSHPWMCGVWPSCLSSAASRNARSRSFFVRAELAPTRRCRLRSDDRGSHRASSARTKNDRDRAFWLAAELKQLGHTPHIHGWELKSGDDIRLEVVTISSPAIHCGRTDEIVAAAAVPVSANFRFVVGRHGARGWLRLRQGFWFSMLSPAIASAHISQTARTAQLEHRRSLGPRRRSRFIRWAHRVE